MAGDPPARNALRDRTSLSCHLSIREQTDSLYIYRAFAAQRLSVNIPIGTRTSCHCTAMGRMLLSGLSPTQPDALYRHVRLDDYQMHQLLERDRERGWVLHRSDYSITIACTVYNPSGEVAAAINLSGRKR